MMRARCLRASTPWMLAGFGSVIITVIEWLKHFIWPGISPWQSHIITILLTTTIISIAAHVIYRYARMHSEARSLMASIVESSDDGIIGQTLDGHIVSWNKGAERLFGYAPDEVRHGSIALLIPSDCQMEMRRILEKIGRGETVNNYETVHLRKDGRPIHVAVTISPIPGDSGSIIGASAIVRDISERKRVEEERAKSNEQLRDLYRRLQSAREEERTRIAREIHDEFGQTLTALKIDLAWMKKQLHEGQAPLLQKIGAMSKIIGMAIVSIKKLSTDLRPGILDDFGLQAAVEWLAEDFESRTGTKCDVRLEVERATISDDISTAIFRILQETFTNIMRHARAKHVALNLKEESGELIFTVRDDGKGISKDEIDPQSYGLMGIRERVFSLGGTAEITGFPGRGTLVSVRIPLAKGRQEHD